eukprot:CAMPEP_0185586530 /NCGR_PEP_ID=MMETSP0434-20130131/44848_1 /TAXON_ID=626734 ORGANISM="Favella taraikaensis, Strain Fe Narragansett Bay" /NCGR_SAMPLE_ID=MMETSP0434 /ASSEMBLY_ACC=CAM_ASM_000379 /LENGTH=46 /DNA_ID= /DNA_START= /DNA_END= /DNA_ORIENTATION=
MASIDGRKSPRSATKKANKPAFKSSPKAKKVSDGEQSETHSEKNRK